MADFYVAPALGNRKRHKERQGALMKVANLTLSPTIEAQVYTAKDMKDKHG